MYSDIASVTIIIIVIIIIIVVVVVVVKSAAKYLSINYACKCELHTFRFFVFNFPFFPLT